jgi:hypothetical protein
MAPRKMSKEYGESVDPNTDVLLDTSLRAIDTVKSWTQVFDILQHELINCPEDSGDEVTETHATKLRDIAESEIQKIATWMRLMPYNNMIGWALENVDISTRSICNSQKVVVGSFRPEHIKVMYKLSLIFKYSYNVEFIMEFDQQECTQYGKNYTDLIKKWWGHPEKFRADTHGIYATTSLDAHMIYVAMMLCRIFGKKDSSHFLLAWVPIMNEVAEGYSFNWAKMLSDNLAKEIIGYQLEKSKGKPSPLYMSAYIMDSIFFITPFPLMSWSWNPTNAEPIHFYHSKLWEDKARHFFYEICHYVVVPIHISLYGFPPPRISDRIMANLGKVSDWYIEENFSYIRVFGCSVPPHALPKFLPDRLVCREVDY